MMSGQRIGKACETASVCTSFCVKTIRRWMDDVYNSYFSTISSFENVTDKELTAQLSSNRGKHPKIESKFSDERFQAKARKYAQDKGFVKGQPNLTLQQFVMWVEQEEAINISISTASRWLHELGFTHKQFSKGVYFDGHERDDVIEDRKTYLATLDAYSPRMWISHSPCPSPFCQPIIRVYHDESTYYANADQSFYWTDGSRQILKQKSLGQAIMVSDFLDEVGGFLKYKKERARLLLEHQTEGYFNNEMLISQVVKSIDIFEKKYPMAQGLFIFDNAPSHMKRPEDALNAERMNVKDGGKQPFMMDTVWNGKVQKMVTDQGIQKGMRTVLDERGVVTDGMNADKLREILREHEVNINSFIMH